MCIFYIQHITPLRPWADGQRKSLRRRRPSSSVYETRVVPIKGVEFMVPIMGYYCNLCDALVGDPLAGEQHLKSDLHRERYQVSVYVTTICTLVDLRSTYKRISTTKRIY